MEKFAKLDDKQLLEVGGGAGLKTAYKVTKEIIYWGSIIKNAPKNSNPSSKHYPMGHYKN